MGAYLQVLGMAVSFIVLLWFGYTLFFGPSSPAYPYFGISRRSRKNKGNPGDPQVCPICSTRMHKGELVQSLAFPTPTTATDRLIYIRGCFSCMEKEVARRCPVCKMPLLINDYLIARMFDRTNAKPHIHVTGCNYCKKMGTLLPV